jgi:hypothetical protein
MSDLMNRLTAAGDVGGALSQLCGWQVYPRSVTASHGAVLFLARQGREKRLGALTTEPMVSGLALSFSPVSVGGEAACLGLGPLSHANALGLRARLPFTAPIRVGVRKSAGLGDRLGIATPGHLRAMRQVSGVLPVLAQQSIREMERTQRTPDEVMDAATWGVLQEGWRAGYGADADHLKNESDIDACVSAGFVMYTLDPRDHVDNDAHSDPVATLRAKFAALPWAALETTPEDTVRAYAGQAWGLSPTYALSMTDEETLRAACKYGQAIAHLARLYRYLHGQMAGHPYELEVSVDETDTPTSPAEHFYIASELKRLGVEWVSLAPRYLGRFEKGVDYIGDLAAFERDFARHVAIAEALGPYKLSLHSGSDKFSLYPIAARLAGELVHLKTAGTSYLEALRAVARVSPPLFREVLAFALARYEQDRASYHVSGELPRMVRPGALSDEALDAALTQFDTRQALHVTFGAVLTARDADGAYLFRDRLYEVLELDEEAHYAALEQHIVRHVMPFAS